MKYSVHIIILICATSSVAFSQIRLHNASFEGLPQDATVPMEWSTCEPGSTPDILPGAWGVLNEPNEGSTFMGLIIRENGSFESVGQFLTEPLQANYCYEFSIYLSHSNVYAGYNLPIGLNIWGGGKGCEKSTLIGSVDMIDHLHWKKYTFRFVPSEELYFFQIEATKAKGVFRSYKGNVLIDNCSVIKLCKRA